MRRRGFSQANSQTYTNTIKTCFCRKNAFWFEQFIAIACLLALWHQSVFRCVWRGTNSPIWAERKANMGISKRLYEEYLDELEAKERAMYGPALIGADGDHMVNCECADCMEIQQLIDRDDK